VGGKREAREMERDMGIEMEAEAGRETKR